MKWAHFLLHGLILLFFVPSFTSAATLYIDPAVSELLRGETLSMSVRLDTDEAKNECINLVDAVITYPENIEPVDVSTGASIFPVWIERPTINKENRTITFAGGIPSGYCGRVEGDPRLTNVLADIVFRSPGFVVGGTQSDSNIAEISFTEQTTAYLNDGQGTKVQLRTLPAQITLNSNAGSGVNNPWNEAVNQDKTPPEKFSIFLEQRDISGDYYIVFNTTDKQTGIDQYQVMEEPLTQLGAFTWGRADAPWVEVTSPYTLEDQSLNSVIRVKALDKAGNEYIANLIPDQSLRTTSQEQMLTYVLLILGIFLLLILLLISFVFIRRKKQKRQILSQQMTEENNYDDDDEFNE